VIVFCGSKLSQVMICSKNLKKEEKKKKKTRASVAENGMA